MKKIFIICTVRNASAEYVKKLEEYADNLQKQGYQVHLPHRDTVQTKSGLEICRDNATAIINADEIHIFYNPLSQGTHFDMGGTFMFDVLISGGYLQNCERKKIVIVDNEPLTEGKSFQRMLVEWQENF